MFRAVGGGLLTSSDSWLFRSKNKAIHFHHSAKKHFLPWPLAVTPTPPEAARLAGERRLRIRYNFQQKNSSNFFPSLSQTFPFFYFFI
jgi:hypothetical protein